MAPPGVAAGATCGAADLVPTPDLFDLYTIAGTTTCSLSGGTPCRTECRCAPGQDVACTADDQCVTGSRCGVAGRCEPLGAGPSTKFPTAFPSRRPTTYPTATKYPTAFPTNYPTNFPTKDACRRRLHEKDNVVDALQETVAGLQEEVAALRRALAEAQAQQGAGEGVQH